MLSTLDTVIAFAVIMTVLSLLITIIVQMVSAAFSLRGKNLANAWLSRFKRSIRTSESTPIRWPRRFCATRFSVTLFGAKKPTRS